MMETGRLIAALFMILIGLFCLIFNKNIYEWNVKWRKLFNYKTSWSEKSISKYIRICAIIAGLGFLALGIYVALVYY